MFIKTQSKSGWMIMSFKMHDPSYPLSMVLMRLFFIPEQHGTEILIWGPAMHCFVTSVVACKSKSFVAFFTDFFKRFFRCYETIHTSTEGTNKTTKFSHKEIK